MSDILMHSRLASLVLAVSVAASLLVPVRAIAAAADPTSDVLHQESRWLTAIVNGDRKTIAAMLLPNYKHITAQGKLIDRTAELAETTKLPFTMNPTQQTVDFAGNVAVVHGVNTLIQSGKVMARERFTDIFVKQNATWMALSAQETAL